MSTVQQNTRNTKNKESMAHSKEKNKLTEIVPEKDLTVDLLDKDVKALS